MCEFFAGTPDAADASPPFPPADVTDARSVGALQGRLTLLMGPPGGGKSTLLKLLSGLLQKDSSLKVSCSARLQQTHVHVLPGWKSRAWAMWHRCIAPAKLQGKAAPQQSSMVLGQHDQCTGSLCCAASAWCAAI